MHFIQLFPLLLASFIHLCHCPGMSSFPLQSKIMPLNPNSSNICLNHHREFWDDKMAEAHSPSVDFVIFLSFTIFMRLALDLLFLDRENWPVPRKEIEIYYRHFIFSSFVVYWLFLIDFILQYETVVALLWTALGIFCLYKWLFLSAVCDFLGLPPKINEQQRAALIQTAISHLKLSWLSLFCFSIASAICISWFFVRGHPMAFLLLVIIDLAIADSIIICLIYVRMNREFILKLLLLFSFSFKNAQQSASFLVPLLDNTYYKIAFVICVYVFALSPWDQIIGTALQCAWPILALPWEMFSKFREEKLLLDIDGI